MTKRVKRLIIAGAAVIGIVAMVSGVMARRAGLWYPAPHVRSVDSFWKETGPRIWIRGDAPDWPVGKAIRIDVKDGVPCERVEGTPIKDVAGYVKDRIAVGDKTWVVITASSKERLRDVVPVIDACRATPVDGIVLNHFSLEDLESRD